MSLLKPDKLPDASSTEAEDSSKAKKVGRRASRAGKRNNFQRQKFFMGIFLLLVIVLGTAIFISGGFGAGRLAGTAANLSQTKSPIGPEASGPNEAGPDSKLPPTGPSRDTGSGAIKAPNTDNNTGLGPDAKIPPKPPKENPVETPKNGPVNNSAAINNNSSAPVTAATTAVAKPPVKILTAELSGQLSVSPANPVATNPDTLISFNFSVTNNGEGRANPVQIKFPVDSRLTVGYSNFTDPRVWVGAVDSSGANSFILINLPALDQGQQVGGSIVFRPQPGAIPGSQVSTSYNLTWTDDGGQKSAQSNAVSLIFSS